MTADLATVPQLHDFLELSGTDCEAAQAVASGLRDTKAENTTRRSYASAWWRFQTWATPADIRHCPPPRRPWPSTWATWQR